MDPWALGVFWIDLSESALVVEGALHGAHGRIKYARPEIEGVARNPVVGNDAIAPGARMGVKSPIQTVPTAPSASVRISLTGGPPSKATSPLVLTTWKEAKCAGEENCFTMDGP